MKYKHVFFIWLIADALIALGTACIGIYEEFTGGSSTEDVGIYLLAVGIGIACSLPSLIVMLLFHRIYTSNAKQPQDYVMPYVALIICINMLYLLTGELGFGLPKDFNLFYVGSTLAGLLAFYLVHRKIRKNTPVVVEQNEMI